MVYRQGSASSVDVTDGPMANVVDNRPINDGDVTLLTFVPDLWNLRMWRRIGTGSWTYHERLAWSWLRWGVPVSDPVRTELRLRPPQTGLTPGLVRRRRLEERLGQGAAGRVTLVSAVAGAGKTSAIAAWLASEGAAGSVVAWMTLDDTDNDLPRFWADLITAMGVAGALPAGGPLSELAPTAGFGAAELLRVWAGLDELPGPVVLVLDDFHEVTDGAVLDSVEEMLDHQGPNLHVVISTRTDPPLRLRPQRLLDPKHGQLTEIRSDDLAFTDTGAAELFDHSGIRVTAIQRHLLLDRTLGWSAGLRMAALSLEATDVDTGIPVLRCAGFGLGLPDR